MATLARDSRRRLRSRHRRVAGAWIAAFGLGLALGCGGQGRPERIVLLVIDTLRDDHVGGTTPPTPHLDALAARGQRLSGAVSSYHQTTMSMASLFTGRTPSLERSAGAPPVWNGQTWCGMGRLAGGPESRCVPDEAKTLAESLSDAGYHTLGVASNPLMFDPAGYSQGFDRWIEVGGSLGGEGELVQAPDTYDWRGRDFPHVRAALERELTTTPKEDVFLYVHLMEVHDYTLRGETYAESVRVADRALGELVALLESWAGFDDTLLVVTSDHGESFLDESHVVRGTRAHFGNPSFEELLRVPLIVVPRLLDREPKALRSDDVHRLIAERAGAEVSPPDLEVGELFVSEGKYRTYREARFKSFESRKDGRLVLVDLAEDPLEKRDVAHLHPEVVARHRARVETLSEALAAEDARNSEALTADERARLESLGYLTPDREPEGAPSVR